MKQPALVPTLLAITLAVSGAMVLAPGCGSSPTGTGGSGGSTTTGTTGGSGGATTSTTTSNAACDAFCSHLDGINCKVLKDCKNDCNNHLNAPASCVKEADALLACWEKNVNDFQCTMTQVLPPPQCADEEKAFNMCVNGGGPDASCICSPGVLVGNPMSCSRKITCATTDFKQVCQPTNDGQPWTCSCFSNDKLLGTCPEEGDPSTQCSDKYGCCIPLFCASAME
jgi:hypothetical protein